MNRRRSGLRSVLAVQAAVVIALAVGYAASPADSRHAVRDVLTRRAAYPAVEVPRREPRRVTPLYDDPEVVSDEELAAVLRQILPRFPASDIRPNHIEHALRAWGVDAVFQDPEVMSGETMKDYLLDHGRFVSSWSDDVEPLLEDRPRGVAVRWGTEDGASVHHDHLLASLSEAGLSLDEPVFPPSGRHATFNDVLQEAIRDFRLDERETEWSALGFALWLPPVDSWKTSDGRALSFDLLARRLMRGHKEAGVCSGTHRVYSLAAYLRLDADEPFLSEPLREEVHRYLESVRDLIAEAQYPDGRWPSNWPDGARAYERRPNDEEYRQVISTGHHLEWLAIAPVELHPPREQVLRAARWIIDHTVSRTPEQIADHYTFYSHVGNALAMWRGTRPADFWREWEQRSAGLDAPPAPQPAAAEGPAPFVPPLPAP